jgi:hypothetical protein
MLIFNNAQYEVSTTGKKGRDLLITKYSDGQSYTYKNAEQRHIDQLKEDQNNIMKDGISFAGAIVTILYGAARDAAKKTA